MDELTLVIPAKNEKESLPIVLTELERYNIKTIVILEESDSDTINAISQYNCDLLFQNQKGYGSALIEGIKEVKTKFFCIFNADGSFNPSELNTMINSLSSNKCDFVFASRYEKNCKSDDDTIITLIGNFIFTKIGNIFFDLNITDILYTFVMGKTDDFMKLNITNHDFRFCVEFPIKAKQANKRLITSKSHERSRIAGKKKVNAFKDGMLILLGLIELYIKKN